MKSSASLALCFFRFSCVAESPSRLENFFDNSPVLRHSRGMSKPALGRGLGALLGGVSPQALPAPQSGTSIATVVAEPFADTRERVQRIVLDSIRPSPFQPRKDFTAEALRELADSIKEQGIVQPLIVRERQGHL